MVLCWVQFQKDMIDNDTTLTSYCFLAALTESNNDLYKGVFLPVTKRALSLYSLKKSKYGTDQDIQEYIHDIYGLNVPITVVRKLLRGVEKNLSRKENKDFGFSVFGNGKNFQIQEYEFTELEEKYKRGTRSANALNIAFQTYIQQEDIEFENIPSLQEFLKNHQSYLSSFFNGKTIEDHSLRNKTFIHHVNFLEYIERNNHELYKIAEHLYLGAVVASFLECDFDYEAKPSEETVYYLDTQIVFEALDLQNEVDTQAIKELFSLITDTSGTLKILDITLDELTYIIDFSIQNFNNQTPTSTINEACLRRGKNKTWLINLNGKLENVLRNDLGIKKETIPKSLKDKFSRHPDLKALQERRVKEANALHDVFAYLFVREHRGGVVRAHIKINSWFISANKNLLRFNIERNIKGTIPETTLPDSLTSLLWIRNPKKYLDKLKSIGLGELLAVTLQEEIASKELINEFDKNLKAIDAISNEDCKILISSVAHQSARYIEHLNELAHDDPPSFNKEAVRLVEKERKQRKDVRKTLKRERTAKQKKAIENKELKERIKEIENGLVQSQQKTATIKTELEKLSTRIKRLAIFLFLTILAVVILNFYLNNIYAATIIDKLVTGILGLGGLWSFGTFTINMIRVLKK